MSEYNIIYNCSPTLAGLKTGNIFNCEIKSSEDIYKIVEDFNKRLEPKGLCLTILRVKNSVALLYLYRINKLFNDLHAQDIKEFLIRKDYPVSSVNECIEELKRRINSRNDFPHEIGLFIGYPIEDVEGFMKYGANGSKYCGAWRVYGNVEDAKKRFALYKKCREVYCSTYKLNNNFEKLIISK